MLDHYRVTVRCTVFLTFESIFVSKDRGAGEGSQRHERGTIKGTMCALPDMILGEAACVPLMIFIPPVVMIVTLLGVFKMTNPIMLGGVGLITMTGMSVIMAPGPIMIAGFIVASGGVGVAMLMIRR